MKKTIVLTMILLGAAVVYGQKPEAVIRELTGTVELKAGGSAEWKAAKAGDTIEEATVISTGFKGTAILAVGSSTFTVRPLTRLSLEALMSRDNTETINVGLRTGRVQVDVKPPAGGRTEFSVQTPVATASVRGTVFDIDPVKVRVSEGSVTYRSSGVQARPVMVSAGQGSQVDTTSGRVVNPIAMAETNRVLQALPGETAAPGMESSRLKVPQGTLAIRVTLDSYED